MKEIKGWCITRPGRYPVFVADSETVGAASKQDAWNIALGWPYDNEIEEAKAKGARASRAKIVEIAEDE